ncbi:YcaO-like family protein [Paracoccus aminophilus]|uniref:YcaO domain-containing protein n=1 Tax=Paracoccus aminophilus JCM 7686 TaxID=1367847 RepID=S5Y5E7_PARAH|nr:YcaO-like family protein [Paracoccus aminophilus]AGT10940.1 hypothetical protein JCM7686_pAMI4p250 [Paracoccus aminophilus JCM 7686]
MTPQMDLDDAKLRARHSVWRLLMPSGGIMSGVTRMTGENGAPDLHIAVSKLGNLSKVFPHVIRPDGTEVANEPLGGAGADLDEELAWIRAVMEGAERYANMAYAPEDFLVTSANQLGAAAIDLDRIARCSKAELAQPGCPYIAPDKSEAIRWTRGWSLSQKCERWVPTVMTHLYARPARNERFWQEISTGVAAHFCLQTAIVSALCEVIERDAISILWLARLGLPKIQIDRPAPPALAGELGQLERSLINQSFFDATSDIGVPTVYSLQRVPGHPATAQYVNCATGFDPAALCAKTIREAAPARPVLRLVEDVPADSNDFRALYDGAHLLGRPEHEPAFDFLTHSTRSVLLSQMLRPEAESPSERLSYIVARLEALGMEPVIVDLTTDELRDLGIWVVRAVIPGLMPMSSVQKGRFLGTPRLYDYPAKAGFGTLCEAQINPLPQPFA